jgi:hypothetical protein
MRAHETENSVMIKKTAALRALPEMFLLDLNLFMFLFFRIVRIIFLSSRRFPFAAPERERFQIL